MFKNFRQLKKKLENKRIIKFYKINSILIYSDLLNILFSYYFFTSKICCNTLILESVFENKSLYYFIYVDLYILKMNTPKINIVIFIL